jgi:WD40 repeat protein
VHCINFLKDDSDNSRYLISGGSDMKIQVINPDDMSFITVSVEAIPKSVDYLKYLLVGLKNGSIVEYDIKKNQKEVIIHSHHEGEVWGLCVATG